MSAASGTAVELEIHDADYPALNCRAGIIAGILRARWGIDPAPVFLRTAIAGRDVVGPMERGEIAGATLGSLADEVWTELFGVRFEQWHPSSQREMEQGLNDALERYGMVLSAQDGFWNPGAADKYQRRHMRHNVLVHGRAGADYQVADRSYRTTLDPATLWRCMEEPSTTFVVVTEAAGFTGDPAELLAAGAARLAAAMATTLDEDEIARMSAATAADVEADQVTTGPVTTGQVEADQRWQQSHFYLNGIGRSRALFARAATVLNGEPASAPVEHAAEAWVVAGRLVYKRLMGGRAVGVGELAERIRLAEAADAGALDAVRALAAGRRADDRP